MAYKFSNCTALRAVYPYGVGKSTVTDARYPNILKSTALYDKIDGYNGSLDRDNDGIACQAS